MNLDLVTAIELTASAAIVIATISRILGTSGTGRITLIFILSLWLCVVVGLAATGALGPENPLGTGGLGLAVMLPMGLLALWIMRSDQARKALASAPLATLVTLNVVRVLGISFLLLNEEGRVAPIFATIAGWGDIGIGVLAVPVAWLVSNKPEHSTLSIWVWNTLGLLDLVAAVGLGVVSSPGPQRMIFETASSAVMTTLPWLMIPGFLVPLLASSHLAIFWKLNRLRRMDLLGNHYARG